MKRIMALVTAAAILGGCDRVSPERAPHGPGQGRYLGVGIYDAGTLWQEQANAEPPKDPKAATLADDSEIVVVVDSATGAIRQCGNFSGRCLSLNPWRGPAGAAPASFVRHAADLAREEAGKPTVEAAPSKPRP
jgi:hypothetical protein